MENNDLSQVGKAAEEVIPVDPPIGVANSPTFLVLGVMLRQLALIGGSFTTLLSLLGARDIRGMFDYIGGSEFILALAATVTAGTLFWGWFRELKAWKKLVTLEQWVPNSIAYIKQKLTDRIL